MATFDFKLSWTLNGFAVPVEKKEVTFLDPQHLALEATLGDLDLDAEVEMRRASFKASSDMKWFLKALELPSKWWISHCRQLPLLRLGQARNFCGSTCDDAMPHCLVK